MKRAFLILALFWFSCIRFPEEPISTPDQYVDIFVEHISYIYLPFEPDSTLFYHDTSLHCRYQLSCADSLADTLKNTNIYITDMWYPAVTNHCLAEFVNGAEVLLKLKEYDPRILELGFILGNPYPKECHPTWRHYEFRRFTRAANRSLKPTP